MGLCLDVDESVVACWTCLSSWEPSIVDWDLVAVSTNMTSVE